MEVVVGVVDLTAFGTDLAISRKKARWTGVGRYVVELEREEEDVIPQLAR